MMIRQRIKVMLPSYNEELNLPSLLARIESMRRESGLDLEVLVVNDGSVDDTAGIARRYTGEMVVKLLDLTPNRGLAGAMREGLKESISDMQDHDILVTLDADDSHDPALIPEMVRHISTGADLVIASRYQKGSRIVGLASYRQFLSNGAGYLFRIFRPMPGVRDYTCGFRAYSVDLLKRAHAHYGHELILQQGFGCMAEILLKLRRFSPQVREIPFVLRYDQKQGASKMNVLKTVKQTLGLIFGSNR